VKHNIIIDASAEAYFAHAGGLLIDYGNGDSNYNSPPYGSFAHTDTNTNNASSSPAC
jgi:hypothetical protein